MTVPLGKRPYRVTCSCGEKSIVRFNHSTRKYMADNISWRFIVNPSTEILLPCGWTCGKKGHGQDSFEEYVIKDSK